jgi:serine/threonine protein kinase
MAKLWVMDDYQGPGERKTAETLAQELPASWDIFAGRKLSGPTRDDLDLVIVGGHAAFVLDEKSWGPRIVLGDQNWLVKGQERRNPLNRVSHLSRVLAGEFERRVPGYTAAVRRHIVTPGVVLSHDTVELVEQDGYSDGGAVVRLRDASAWLLHRDSEFGAGMASVRPAIIEFLSGLSARDSRPRFLGPYEIVQELAPIESARCFAAVYNKRLAVLRCYPLHGWGPNSDPQHVFDREHVALGRLEERGRTWQIHAAFTDEARQWFVVPVVPSLGRDLVESARKDDPPRDNGRLASEVALGVVTDAFRGLAEVHVEGLTHRGLYPRRVDLGPSMRVKFSDFYFARVSGERTIVPDVTGDADPSVPYRAPECRASLALARAESDVYSLALSLCGWVLGDFPDQPDVAAIRESIRQEPLFGLALADCLAPEYSARPSAARAAELIEEAVAAIAPPPPPVVADEFRVGGVVGGQYEIREFLGQGGYARTWLAWDSSCMDERVLKQFDSAKVDADKVRKEFTIADKVRNDHCSAVYRVVLTDPAYLELEYVPGCTLRKYAMSQPRSAEGYQAVAADILDALAYLDEHGYVHQDVTPANVIVAPDGRAKLIDFGVAGALHATEFAGTPPFMAPEVLAGESATPSSDVYGFAVSMIHSMLGRYPYAGDPADKTDNRAQLQPPSEDECRTWGPLGSAMLDVLYLAVDFDPAKRLGSAKELQAKLDVLRLIDDQPELTAEGPVDDADEDRAELPKTRVENPSVNSLRGLYRASSLGNGGNRGLDDEFALATYVPTLLDRELLPAILKGEKRLVLLTGNPGDGKTSFLVNVGKELLASGAEKIDNNAAGWKLRRDGHVFVAVYDASESHEGKTSDDLMQEALIPGAGEDPARRTVLLAINDGRLLQFFTDYQHLYEDERREINRQAKGDQPRDPGIVLVDLKRRTLAPRPGNQPSLAGQILDTFTSKDRWAACDGCLSRAVCPMRRNAEVLLGPAKSAVEELVATSHLRRQRRATFRDVRSALAWLITGDRSCADIHEAREKGMNLSRGDGALVEDLAFDERSADYLVQEWLALDPAGTAAPDAERAARADRRIVDEPAKFSARDRELVQRRLYFGTWTAPGLGRETVRAYRHFDAFDDVLLDGPAEQIEELRGRLLLGLSRLLGAPGYRGTDLAVADQAGGGTWAVLKEIKADGFTLAPARYPSAHIESRPDALVIRHTESGHALALTLDTFEIVLRVADGDLIGDGSADSVRQEIEAFAAALRRSPTSSVTIVNPAGTPWRATVTASRQITLERS